MTIEFLPRDGYTVLRNAVPPSWLDELRAAFDAGVRPSSAWPVPRGPGWRHACLDLDPRVRELCRLPGLLAAAGSLIGEDFFLAQVEGREPLPGDGHQALHRDLSAQRPGDTVLAMAYLDDFGPFNGATRLVPGTHRPAADQAARDLEDESRALQLEGKAGDVLVFDADLVHAGSLNVSGARRRSLLINYMAQTLHAQHQQTAALRGVRMAEVERFAVGTQPAR